MKFFNWCLVLCCVVLVKYVGVVLVWFGVGGFCVALFCVCGIRNANHNAINIPNINICLEIYCTHIASYLSR